MARIHPTMALSLRLWLERYDEEVPQLLAEHMSVSLSFGPIFAVL